VILWKVLEEYAAQVKVMHKALDLHIFIYHFGFFLATYNGPGKSADWPQDGRVSKCYFLIWVVAGRGRKLVGRNPVNLIVS